MLWLTRLSIRSNLSVALWLSAATACSSSTGPEEPDDVAPTRSELKCSAGVIEADLEMQPTAGSAVDLSTGELALDDREYIVSSTYGIPKRDPDTDELPASYQALMGQIIQQLATQPGLLSLSLGSSTSCGSGRTLAVWESEELMYEFVTSPAHLEAMRTANELLLPGYGVTHWMARGAEEMTLSAAVEHLGSAR
jgi:hypothetical protein